MWDFFNRFFDAMFADTSFSPLHREKSSPMTSQEAVTIQIQKIDQQIHEYTQEIKGYRIRLKQGGKLNPREQNQVQHITKQIHNLKNTRNVLETAYHNTEALQENIQNSKILTNVTQHAKKTQEIAQQAREELHTALDDMEDVQRTNESFQTAWDDATVINVDALERTPMSIMQDIDDILCEDQEEEEQTTPTMYPSVPNSSFWSEDEEFQLPTRKKAITFDE